MKSKNAKKASDVGCRGAAGERRFAYKLFFYFNHLTFIPADYAKDSRRSPASTADAFMNKLKELTVCFAICFE